MKKISSFKWRKTGKKGEIRKKSEIFFKKPLTKRFMGGIINIVDCGGYKKRLGVAQLVARYLGVVEAVGSSPVTQTRCNQHYSKNPILV